MSNGRKKPFNSLLFNYKTENTSELTHTRIGSSELNIYSGKYKIGKTDEKDFYKSYYKHVFVKNNHEYLTEKQLKDVGQILVDLDFRYSTDIISRQHEKEHVMDLVSLYLDKIGEILNITNKEFPIFIFEKPNVNNLADVTKDGIHIIIGIQMKHSLQLLLRKKILESIDDILSDLSLTNDYNSVLDIGISKGTTNWQLYGSRKPGNEAYQLINYYKASLVDDDWEINCQKELLDNPPKKFILNLLPIMSARNKNAIEFDVKPKALEELEKENLRERTKIKPKKYRAIVKRSGITNFANISNEEELDEILETILTESEESDKYHLNEAHGYTMILSSKYYDNYNEWLDIGWILFCINYNLFPTWIKFSSQSNKFSYDDIPDYLEKWEAMEVKGKSIGSLIYYAKECNLIEYNKIKKESISYYVNKTLKSSAEYDIAMVLYKLVGEEFVCISPGKKIWYQYKNGRWAEISEGVTLRKKLSNELHMVYMKRQQMIIDKIVNITNDQERAEFQGLVQKLCEISIKLKKTTWKNNIMKEASELFYNPHFIDKLDSNPYLLCFNNGIIDFENNGIFRKGRPEDYVSLCTKINYIPYNKSNKEHEEIKGEVETFFKQLFPNPDLNKYMWEHLSSVLLGKNLNQTFNMYTGCGRNGKSKLVEFISTMLGTYKGTVPISLVTQKRGSIGGVSPEIAGLKGLRYAVMQEPSKGMMLNEGVMKELTGGDPIQGRKLFKDVVTFVPQFSLVVCTNHLFEIGTGDDGTWRRIRVCDFVSKFVSQSDLIKMKKENPKEHAFLVNPKIDENFSRWREITLSLLVDMAIATGGKVEDSEIVMASSNRYKEQQDHFTAFYNTRIIKCAGESCSCSGGKTCKMKRRDVLEIFKDWYLELYGTKSPPGKELYEFLQKKMGKHTSKGYIGYRVVDPNLDEDSDDFESHDI